MVDYKSRPDPIQKSLFIRESIIAALLAVCAILMLINGNLNERLSQIEVSNGL